MSPADIKDRTIIVTGASRGIGLAVARRLHAAGARVVGISRTAPGDHEDFLHHVELDLSDTKHLPAELHRIAAAHPDASAVVLNAGAGRFGDLEQFSAEQVQALVQLNLVSPMLVAREFLPALKRRGAGDLVFIGSEAALRGGRRGAVYSATKFGLRGFVQSLRQECGSAGVRVGIVNPGMVDTAFFDDLAFRPGQEKGQHLIAEDVADAVAFMLTARPGAVVDEINLSPAQHVIDFSRSG
jgi:NAD(P)-dependent dehydrogenase (short-subunit alcohol dehydrogenase family)